MDISVTIMIEKNSLNEYYSLSCMLFEKYGNSNNSAWKLAKLFSGTCSPFEWYDSQSTRHVSFMHLGLDLADSMKALNKFVCTTHISMDNYANRGNVTVRYFETLACNVPALVPTAFYMPEILGKKWTVNSRHGIF